MAIGKVDVRKCKWIPTLTCSHQPEELTNGCCNLCLLAHIANQNSRLLSYLDVRERLTTYPKQL